MDEKRFNEDKIFEMLRNSAENVEVPESLSPDNILKKLEQQEAEKEQAAVNENRKKITWKKVCVRLLETAAVLMLAFTAGYHTKGSLQWDMEASVETEAERAEIEFVQTEKAAEPLQVDITAQEDVSAETFAPAADSAELFQKLWDHRNLQRIFTEYGKESAVVYGMAVEESVEMEAAAAMDMGTGSTAQNTSSVTGTSDFSQTNLRELGVDEGDIVKTDGEYLYIMKRNSSVRIAKINGPEMEIAAVIQPENLSESVEDMYLDGEQLILITSGTRSQMNEEEQDVYTVQNYNYAKVITYDISDRTNPQIKGSVEQEGYYRSSRKAGNYIYLFSIFEPQLESTEDNSKIMPLLEGEEMPAQNIYVPDYMVNSRYLVMASVNIQNPSEVVDSKAMVSGADNFYVSQKNIYIYNDEWREGGNITHIMKFRYEDGRITGVGAGRVDGYLNDSFSIDEYNGYLRMVTTDWTNNEEINNLFILDENLQMVGKITDIAPGETIRSARFMGDTGYFVTFRQTDPLFSVDLSDPENPKILGELKITGFSSYLHFYGEDQLLGIGYEADPETGITTGVKLSMFDISDPANVTEVKKYVIKDAGYVPGMDNYKAIMIDPAKNLFGFACDGDYLVFSYDETEGFRNKLTHHLETEKDEYWYDNEGYRGVYVNDYFYLADAGEVLAFDMENGFELTEKLELN